MTKYAYWDITLVNAHPVLARHLPAARENPIDYEPLLDYTSSPARRTALMQEIQALWQVRASVAKILPLMLLNGGTVQGWREDHDVALNPPDLTWPEFVRGFCRCCNLLMNRDLDLYHADVLDLARLVSPNLSDRDLRCKALSYVLQKLEDQCLHSMEQTAVAHGWRIDVLIYDGGLLRRRPNTVREDVLQLLVHMKQDIFDRHQLLIDLAVKDWD